jgi:RNA polymerase sigma factor (sigma-70 family)
VNTTTVSKTGSRTKEFFQRRTLQGWEPFAAKYGPKLRTWCLSRGLAESDAEDVGQAVLLKLYEKWQTSCALWDEEKGSLRAWLRTVARNAWNDACVKRQRDLGPGGQQVDVVLENAPGPEHFLEHFVHAELLQVALDQTQASVTDNEWKVFRLRVFEHRSAREVAELLRITEGSVNNYTSKVRAALKEEMKLLEGPSGS